MLFAVYVTDDRDQPGSYAVITPDLPECTAHGYELGQLLARVHLKIEGHVGQLLLDKKALPQPRTLQELRKSGEFSAGALYEIYLEDHQLAAMAVHQAGK